MNDDLHTYIEPELEARITALVLGEASEFEVDELERLIKDKPELAIFHRRVVMMHQLLGDAMLPPKDEQWQLSEDRRAELKRTFSKTTQATSKTARTTQPSQKHISIWKKQIRASVVIAACVMLCLILFMMATPLRMNSESYAFEPEIVSYSASEEFEDEMEEAKQGQSFSYRSSTRRQAPTQSKNDASPEKKWAEKSLTESQSGIPDASKSEGLFKSKGRDRVTRREIARSVERKPSNPSSSMARTIASNTTTNVPVPEVVVPVPSVDFGNGDDFGDGWGGGAGGGSDPFAATDGEATISKNGKAATSGRKDRDAYGYVAGGVVQDEERQSGFDFINPVDFTQIPGIPEDVNRDVSGIATAGLRSGDYAITRNSIDAILSNPNRLARSGKGAPENNAPGIGSITGVVNPTPPTTWSGGVSLSFDDDLDIDDPIRTSQALSYEHRKKVDEVRKNLYMGEGYYNLGKYDEAEAEYKKVIQKDPYNKAARRWLEKVAATKSDYDRAAYDHTRAELLKEVDKAWEMSVPPEENGRLVVKPVAKAKPAPQVTTIPSPVTPKALPDETITAAAPFSTFSLNVSDVSFKLAKVSLLEKGKWPDATKVRTEEFVNAFDYGDPSPRRGDSVACAIEQSAHPFLQQRNLLRVGMKTAAIGRSAPLRLTILLDNSGSMEREDREESVLAAIRVLAAQLGPQDVITVVGFARQPRLLADRIRGDKAGQLVEIVANTPSEGGTNIEEALRLARTLAKRQHTEGAQDRVVLITDGVANLGNTIPEELSKQITAMRQEGIAFDACGVGAEGLNDDILEALTRKGDGRYYFLNRAEDADSGFAKQLAGALTPAAKNVKVQVKFNPKRVMRYRLLGFEKHRLKKEDFRNDKVDAAEMAAEEAGNAVYQVQVNPQGEGELGQVFVRFLDVSTGRMVERSWPLPYEPQAPSFDQTTPSMQLAGTAAMLGEKLHGTDAGSVRFSMITNTLNRLRGHFAADSRVQDLIRMCRKVK